MYFIITGHFGSVYKGYLTVADQKVDELVAVKTLHRKYEKNGEKE